MRIAAKISKYTSIILICSLSLIPFYILLVLSQSSGRIHSEGNILYPIFICRTISMVGKNHTLIGHYQLRSNHLSSAVYYHHVRSMAAYTIARFNNKVNKAIFGCFSVA